MPKPLTDRERQVATMKERYGKGVYSKMAELRMKTMTKEERSELGRRAILKRHHPTWSEEEIVAYVNNSKEKK